MRNDRRNFPYETGRKMEYRNPRVEKLLKQQSNLERRSNWARATIT